MADRNNVAPGMLPGQPLDDRSDPLHQIDEAFAARCAGVRRRQPEQVLGVEFGVDVFAFAALPVAEILLGKVLLDDRLGQAQTGGADGFGRLVGALQMTGHQGAVFGQ